MRASGGQALIIATLIAAGRLDDRLLGSAALGARLAARACSAGSTRATPPTSQSRDAPAGPRRRWRAGEGVDVDRPAGRHRAQEAARRRHGFDHHRPGMHRRAGRLCRASSPRSPRSPSGRCSGELDFAAALRERVALLKGLDEAVIDALPGRAGPAQSRRGDPGQDDARCAARRPCWCRAASPPSPRRSRRLSASTEFVANRAVGPRRQADRRRSRGGSSMPRSSATRWSKRASELGLARSR